VEEQDVRFVGHSYHPPLSRGALRRRLPADYRVGDRRPGDVLKPCSSLALLTPARDQSGLRCEVDVDIALGQFDIEKSRGVKPVSLGVNRLIVLPQGSGQLDPRVDPELLEHPSQVVVDRMVG
jgi:hypothetical protein